MIHQLTVPKKGMALLRLGWTEKSFGSAAKTRASKVPRRDFVRRLARAVGVPPHRIVWMDQVHGTRVRTISTAPKGRYLCATDGCVTSSPNLALCVRSADCLPILLYDVGGKSVGALHAGWRGLLGGIVDKGVSAMCRVARCRPSRLAAVLGPSIQKPCYDVGMEIRREFLRAYGPFSGRFFQQSVGRIQFSLEDFCVWRLAAAGLDRKRVRRGRICTACGPAEYFSHRARGESGRIAAYIFKAAGGMEEGSWRTA